MNTTQHRYEVYNPLALYFKSAPPEERNRIGFIRKYKSIADQVQLKINRCPGYTEHKEASARVQGEKDFIVIDHCEKRWCWWSAGFYPFSSFPQDFPDTHNLDHWASRRS